MESILESLPETCQTDSKVTSGNVVLDIIGFGTQDAVCDDNAKLWNHDSRHPPLETIRDDREPIRCNRTGRISGDRQQLSIGRCVSHILDDLRHRELQTVVGSHVAPEHEDQEVYFPIHEDGAENAPVECLLFMTLGFDAACRDLA